MGHGNPVGGKSEPTIDSGRSSEYSEVIFSEKTNWGWAEGRVTIWDVDKDSVNILIWAYITDKWRIEKILTIEETAHQEFAIDGVTPLVDTEYAELATDPNVLIQWSFGSRVREKIAKIAERLGVYQYIQRAVDVGKVTAEELGELKHNTLVKIVGLDDYILKEIKKLAEIAAKDAGDDLNEAIDLIDSMTTDMWHWEE